MNKKISLALAAVVLGTTFAYAHDTGVPHEEPGEVGTVTATEVRLVPISADGRKPVTAAATQPGKQPMNVVRTDGKMVIMGTAAIATGTATLSAAAMPMPMMVSTGDAAIDAQILALNKEMEVKMKALRDEYAVKIKAIIGDKKIIPQMNTVTIRRAEAGTVATGSGNVEVMMTQDGGQNVMYRVVDGQEIHDEMHNQAQPSTPGQPTITGNFIKNFFKGLFGR